jgi:Winged helix-turn helix
VAAGGSNLIFGSCRTCDVRVRRMRPGVTFAITAADLDRLRVLISDRNTAQKRVWRARIVLLSAKRLGTNAIMRETGKSKASVWRWQERFAAEEFEGLLHGKTRPSRITKVDTAIAERILAFHGAAVARGHALDRRYAVDLRAAINRFLDDHNANSKPTHRMGR